MLLRFIERLFQISFLRFHREGGCLHQYFFQFVENQPLAVRQVKVAGNLPLQGLRGKRPFR
jgi:hypothetical protein